MAKPTAEQQQELDTEARNVAIIATARELMQEQGLGIMDALAKVLAVVEGSSG